MTEKRQNKPTTISSFKYQMKLKYEAVRKGFWQQVHHRKGESRPIFLVGCGRSGTSMMIWQLNKSWQIELYNEDHPVMFDFYRLRSLDIMDRLVNNSAAPITLFKPILDTTKTNILLDRYLNAKAVFAFRHYNDVINSSLKKFGADNRINHVRRWIADDFAEFSTPPPETTKAFIRERWNPEFNPETGAALYWLFYNWLFYDMGLAQNGRVWPVRYETLVQNPDQEIRLLADFMEIKFEEKMVTGIHNSSIKRDDAPPIDAHITADCEALYQTLTSDTAARREKQTAA